MSQKLNSEIAVIGIDIGKNSLHLIGQDRRGNITPHHEPQSADQLDADLQAMRTRRRGNPAGLSGSQRIRVDLTHHARC